MVMRLYPLIVDNDHNLKNNDDNNQRTRSSINEDHHQNVVMSLGGDSSTEKALFNLRRRDFFLDDYKNKEIQIVDTIANNSIIINKYKTNNMKQTSLNPSPLVLAELTVSPSTIMMMTNQSTITPLHTQIELEMKPQRPNILLPKLEQTGRPSCLTTPDDTFCENVDNYPNRNIIKQEVDFSIDQFAEIFGNKEIDGRTIMDVENDESVCGKTPRVIYPKMAKNQANQWIYVVNEVEYTQAVVAEICQRPGKPCAYMDSLPMGLSSTCKQKYSYKRLLALHPTEKRTYPDAFRFPSCCSCYIKTIDDFMARINQNLWQIPSPLTTQYASRVRKLDLSYNCLQTLSGIEYFNCLEELVLDNNLLDDSIRFFYNPFMKCLSINKNKLTDLERFLNEITLKLPSLTYLSMLGNPACPDQLSSSEHDDKDYSRYRSYVIHRMPQLKFLDSTQIRRTERTDAQQRGHYYRLIRLNSDSVVETNKLRSHLFTLREQNDNNDDDGRQNNPLPFTQDNGQPKGGFGKLKHRYTGKHSEGNRFIRNHEL
ncbi:hypothetical protein DERF_012593 [Dermatophagoides farinae]|uniref:Spaetzle domain-containing protein n=1 Tax=Dermatophagoides farinae TaxID=6954 RepID=A0A922HS71_DERFA|nr:hypothetical protein DERF_012593 [Dermatophagoides farinae]